MSSDIGQRNGRSRRSVLREIGGATAVLGGGALAGCLGFPFGSGADAAYYHAYGPTLDVDYDKVLTTADEAGYRVEEPYYVNHDQPNGIHPAGAAALDDRFGPEYRVFGVDFYFTRTVLLNVDFTRERPTASLFDDRIVFEEFPVTSLPPEDWIVDRLTLAFEMVASRAAEYVGELKEAINEGTDIPSVEITEPPSFLRSYRALTDESTDRTGSETHGDGWYEETFFREDQRVGSIDFVVQSGKIIRDRGDHRYTVKLDRLGGFNCTIQLDPNQEIPESEYRAVFRELFAAVGLPPHVVDTLEFEYTPTVW